MKTKKTDAREETVRDAMKAYYIVNQENQRNRTQI
jgi:hypothetical protein